MNDFLDIVDIVIHHLTDLDPFMWLFGALVVCACAIFVIRLILWR